ncbi:hypothetical protein LOZ12_004777 [Ophidiomyces ophidiicola]|nr:hypothetical protein LOZ62_005050 [Ophidiomyces ophidiicola]KAI2047176.1 hypothetical protein LOZ44_004280 [Ophidiomyces ophidiicola]KAI2053964.1 hypothetical protein LOZ38_001493 [Ophidiomyces ophidiicola]KAI2075948.1 hypothetical protein LOZ37_003399 [Ophidiomyces ophidiicola]KAI2092070.1 hypothetical protein LOZ35_004762 [Ophidiomyces ophidiicola]
MAPLSKEIVTDSDSTGGDSSSSSESEEKSVSKSNTTKSTSTVKSKSKSKSKPDPAPKPSSASSSDSESEVEEVTASKKNLQKRVTIDEEASIIPIPAKPFYPPDGFKPAQNSSIPPSKLTDAFSDLTGKQIWHITAPSAVPVSAIKQLALDAVATGEPILTHKDVSYRLREDQIGADKTKSFLLPDKNGKGYRRQRMDVVQTFHIEQVVDTAGQGSKSDIEAMKKKTKPLPSQPEDLRMRYTPFGSSVVEGNHETLPDDSHTFKVPIGASHTDEEVQTKKKRKHVDIDNTKESRNGVDVPAQAEGKSPRKKSKKDHSQDDHGRQKLEESKDSSDIRGRPEKSGDQSSSKKHRDETSQERRARREERKRKKSEKGPA